MNPKLPKLLQKARSKATKGKFAAALVCLRKACTYAPRDAKIWRETGSIAIANQCTIEGIEALFRAADLEAQTGAVDNAVVLCEEVLSIDPNHRGAHSILRMMQRRTALRRLSSTPPPERPSTLSGTIIEGDNDRRIPSGGAGRLTTARIINERVYSSPFLQGLDDQLLRMLIQISSPIRVAPGDPIFSKGDPGKSLFLIIDGSVNVIKERPGQQRQIKTLESGSIFGEMAFLSGFPRTATVEASQPTLLLELSGTAIQSLIRRDKRVLETLLKIFQDRMIDNVVTSSPFFPQLSVRQRLAVTARFHLCDIPAGQVVIMEKSQATNLYLVLAGRLSVWTKQDDVTVSLGRLRPGDVFGEMGLLGQTTASATISSNERVWLLRLPRQHFEPLMNEYPSLRAGLKLIAKSRQERNQRVLG